MPRLVDDLAEKHWRAMALSCNFPWFIVTFGLDEDGLGIEHSVCVWRESDLVTLAQDASNGRLIALGCVLPPWATQPPGSWSIRTIHSLWLAKDSLADDREVVVFRYVDGQEICDLLTGSAPHAGITNRQLLFVLDTPPDKEGES